MTILLDGNCTMNLSQCGKPLIAISKHLNNMTINGRWESCPNGKFIMWFTINYMILCSPTANAIESNSEIGLRTKGGAGLQYKSRPVI